MARQRDVDLVEVAAQANPPVARLMDFGRFKYEQSKKDREAKKHQVKTQLREVRMKPKIDDHDIDFKTRTAAKLLKQGDKVKVTVMFRGREITHPQIGKNLLDRVVTSLDDIATVEREAMLEGRIQDHPFSQFEFPGAPLGLYDGRPWFLPFAGAWHKILDWVE